MELTLMSLVEFRIKQKPTFFELPELKFSRYFHRCLNKAMTEKPLGEGMGAVQQIKGLSRVTRVASRTLADQREFPHVERYKTKDRRET